MRCSKQQWQPCLRELSLLIGVRESIPNELQFTTKCSNFPLPLPPPALLSLWGQHCQRCFYLLSIICLIFRRKCRKYQIFCPLPQADVMSKKYLEWFLINAPRENGVCPRQTLSLVKYCQFCNWSLAGTHQPFNNESSLGRGALKELQPCSVLYSGCQPASFHHDCRLLDFKSIRKPWWMETGQAEIPQSLLFFSFQPFFLYKCSHLKSVTNFLSSKFFILIYFILINLIHNYFMEEGIFEGPSPFPLPSFFNCSFRFYPSNYKW